MWGRRNIQLQDKKDHQAILIVCFVFEDVYILLDSVDQDKFAEF